MDCVPLLEIPENKKKNIKKSIKKVDISYLKVLILIIIKYI